MSNNQYLNPWTDEELQWLKDNYLSKNVTECAKHLKRTRNSVAHKAHKLGLKGHYFSRFDGEKVYHRLSNFESPLSCYLLGLLWGDGHASKNNGRVAGFEIVLINKDMKDLEWIFDSLGSLYKDELEGKYTRYRMTDVQLGEFLKTNDYHIKSSTTPTKILAKISEQNKPYFYRGWLDADGCWHRSSRNSMNVVLAGTYDQNWLEYEALLKNLDIKYFIRRSYDKYGNHGSIIGVSNRIGMRKIGSYIYSTYPKDQIGLSRKYEKYSSFIEAAEIEINKDIAREKIKEYIRINPEVLPKQLANMFNVDRIYVKALRKYTLLSNSVDRQRSILKNAITS